MKTKLIMPIILCIVVGFFMGQFLISQYDNKENVSPVFKNQESVYFIRQGIYSSKESMEKNVTDFAYYIYSEENNQFHVYVGITNNDKNIDKLKGFFKDMGYDIYVKEINIDNKKFLEILNQYDLLLAKTEDKQTIKVICSQVLAKYEELVITDEH